MPHSGGSVNWNMSATPQTSGPPAPIVMRDPPQYSKSMRVVMDAFFQNGASNGVYLHEIPIHT